MHRQNQSPFSTRRSDRYSTTNEALEDRWRHWKIWSYFSNYNCPCTFDSFCYLKRNLKRMEHRKRLDWNFKLFYFGCNCRCRGHSWRFAISCDLVIGLLGQKNAKWSKLGKKNGSLWNHGWSQQHLLRQDWNPYHEQDDLDDFMERFIKKNWCSQQGLENLGPHQKWRIPWVV